MKVSNVQPIGTHFEKGNIFLATVSCTKKDTKDLLKEKLGEEDITSAFVDMLLEKEVITSEEVDIFYKDEKGYTRFVEEGPETFVGDNSDGKGFVRNIVPIWDYYSEDEVNEAIVNDSFTVITVVDDTALYRYNQDYNKC